MKAVRLRAILVCLAPMIVGAIGSLLWWLSGERRQLEVSVPLTLLVVQAGAILTAAMALVWAHRVYAARRFAAGQDEAEDARRQAHRQFLGRLDHELKNPLTAIRAATADAGPGSNLAIIDAQSSRMSRLLTDLRKLSDLETAPLHFEEVDVEETTRDAVEAVQQELAAKGESREFALAFPEVPWPLPHVMGDPDLLYSAVYNMVSNAAKYTESHTRIEVRGSEGRGTVTLEVADTGIGIPPEDIHVVWAELGRASNARGLPGHGLGLALVSTIVSRHGGTISLTSRLGVGTRIGITLPAAGR